MNTEQVTGLAHGLLADADRMDGVSGQLRGVIGELSTRAWWGPERASGHEHPVGRPAQPAGHRRRRRPHGDDAPRDAHAGRDPGSWQPPGPRPAGAGDGVYPGGRLADAASRYRELTAGELRQLGVTQQMLRDDRTEDGRTVVSFRGSGGRGLKDFGLTDIPNGLHLPSPQGGQAIALAQRVAARWARAT